MADRKENGQLKKGHGGLRGKGVLNKTTQANRELISAILEGQNKQAVKALNSLFTQGQYDQYLKHYIALLEYVTPKLQRVEYNPNEKNPIVINLGDMSTAQIVQVLNESPNKSST